jgi:hypothetical protein
MHTLRFRDHEEFHRTALHMGVAGVLAGLAVHVAGLVYAPFGGLTSPWGLAGVMAASAYGATAPKSRLRFGELGLLVALALAAAVFLHYDATIGAGVMALAFGVLAAHGSKRMARVFVVAVGMALVARFVLLTFATSDVSLPSWVVAAFAGGAFALVGALGVLPRHLEIREDRVADARRACEGKLTGEVKDLAERATAVWSKVAVELEEDAPMRKALEDSVVRIHEVALKWASLDSDGARTSVEGLVDRMAQLELKVEAAEDPITKGQYQSAIGALAEQLRYLKGISTSRERVIARMHHYLAAMERLRFAVLNHRSADASRLSTEVQPILEDLKDLGTEIDSASEAIGEVERAELH